MLVITTAAKVNIELTQEEAFFLATSLAEIPGRKRRHPLANALMKMLERPEIGQRTWDLRENADDQG